MIPQIASLTGAQMGEATASGVSSAAKLPYPYNLGAIASVIATMAGVISEIMSFKNSFAEGGIFGGSTTIGDYNIARVNKGEMILNQREQGRLFGLLSAQGGIGGGVGAGEVVFRIDGQQLVGVLKNQQRKSGRVL